MGNDNQIKETRALTHEATTLFIHENHKHNLPPKLYDLDLEFAKTKKNKNKVIGISLIIFTTIFIAAAYFVTKYIEFQNSQIPISIDAFEDVNLREIFDKAKQHEKSMQTAQRDLKDLFSKKKSIVTELTLNAERAITLIDTQDAPNKQNKINKVRIELKSTIEAEEELWQAEIVKANTRIDAIQTDIDSYDTRILEKAKEQEGIINNQQKRFDMEMEKSVEYYEDRIEELKEEHSQQIKNITMTNKEIIGTIREKNRVYVNSLENKYNPEFGEGFSYISESDKVEVERIHFIESDIDNIVFDEGLIVKEDMMNQFIAISRAGETYTKLKEVPYYNSPKEAIDYLENSYNESIDSYATLVKNLTPVIRDKNNTISDKNDTISDQTSELEQVDNFFRTFVKTNRVNGVIVDSRYKDIKVYIDPIYRVKEDTIGLIFRNDSDFLGTVKFKHIDGILVAQIEQLVDKNRGLEPFDMILINLK